MTNNNVFKTLCNAYPCGEAKGASKKYMEPRCSTLLHTKCIRTYTCIRTRVT